MSYQSGILNVIVSQRYLHRAGQLETNAQERDGDSETVQTSFKINELAKNTSSFMADLQTMISEDFPTIDVASFEGSKWSPKCSTDFDQMQGASLSKSDDDFSWPPTDSDKQLIRDLYIYGSLDSACETVGILSKTLSAALSTTDC